MKGGVRVTSPWVTGPGPVSEIGGKHMKMGTLAGMAALAVLASFGLYQPDLKAG